MAEAAAMNLRRESDIFWLRGRDGMVIVAEVKEGFHPRVRWFNCTVR